ncbi:mechanosensitive ion channel protein [Novosphingobium sp. PC22D]|uniref:mechanosensitive ion channel family protein n=1 Tax=Novosphingobium sp. PC22D TaxID=1962403 RepID=UPI000BF191ED|nr:mechanosensitive ion channel domain-containing protein [Novosphingobium sp. PC22D]PEQ12629.1 mechanosensitive ion channel protein [Novosphingobium sp. PC22D]
MSAALQVVDPEAFASEAPVPVPSPTATVTRIIEQQPVSGADGIKEAVASKSETFGGLVNTLDSLALQVGTTRISLWDMIVVLLVIAVVIVVGYFGGKFANRLIEKLTRFDQTQRLLAEKLVSLLVWAIAIMVGIDVLGIDLTALAVFSGAFGLAIGFGLQKTFGNLIAGIILLLDKSIKPGDVIAVADQAGNSTFGQIQKIGIRAVSLTTRDQKEYLIPNENLMINQVENWSYSSRNVRMQVQVGVSYLADMTKAEALMLEAARSVDRVLDVPPPTVWWESYGDSSVNFIIHCWIRDPEEGVGNVRSAVLKRLWNLFKEHDIEIPYPQRDINLRDGKAFRELLAAMRENEAPGRPDPKDDG